MIKLKVEEYCHTCPEFRPAIYDRDITEVYDGCGNIVGVAVNGDIVINCYFKSTCDNIRNHFKNIEV